MTDTATVTVILPLYPRSGQEELAEHLLSWAPGPVAAGLLVGGTALATSWSPEAAAVAVGGAAISAVMLLTGRALQRTLRREPRP